MMVSVGLQHAASVTEDGNVCAWGNKSNGHLGVVEVNPRLFISYPQRVNFGLPALAVACGETFTLLLTSDGGVWRCGMEICGQLGHGNDSRDKQSMTEIDCMHFSGKKVVVIAAGRAHCIALCSSNDSNSLWTWGSNSHCRLGHNNLVTRYVLTCMKNEPRIANPYQETKSESDTSEDSEDHEDVSVILPDDQEWCLGAVSGIDAGAMTTVVLFVDGTLTVCGDGRESALGLGNLRSKSRLTRVGRDGYFRCAGVRAMVVSFNHIITVTWENRVHSWGSGMYGELGQERYGRRTSPCLVELPLPSGVRVKTVAAGCLHQCIVTQDGSLVVWGTWRNKVARTTYCLAGQTVHADQRAATILPQDMHGNRVGRWHNLRTEMFDAFCYGSVERPHNTSPVRHMYHDALLEIGSHLQYKPGPSIANPLRVLIGFPPSLEVDEDAGAREHGELTWTIHAGE